MTDASLLPHVAGTVERSGIREVFNRANATPGVISLAIGEPSETADAHVVRAAAHTGETGDTHYTDVLGIPELRRAAAAYTARVKGLHYSADTETEAVPGASFGLYLAVRTIIGHGDEVIIPSPGFTSYEAQVHLAGGIPVPVPLRAANGMRISAADIEAAITPRTTAIILNSPGNPTGVVTPLDELEKVAASCIRHNLWAISDEVYHPFVYPAGSPVAPSIAAVPGMRGRTVIVESLSKTFAMTGWRVGYLHAPANFIEQASTIAEFIHSSINGPAQHAGIAALTGPTESLIRRVERYDQQRHLVVDAVRQTAALDILPADGAFYAFIDIRGTGLDDAEFARRLLAEKLVAVVPGSAFGHGGDGFVRVSYVGDESQLREALVRMVDFADHVRNTAAPAASRQVAPAYS